jgi:hypothetical protein
VREALWGKAYAFEVNHHLYESIRALSGIRDAHPALRYGRQHFKPISGDVRNPASPRSPPERCHSREPSTHRSAPRRANASTQADFNGHIIIDPLLHTGGDAVRILNKPVALADGAADVVRVNLQPMDVEILGSPALDAAKR